MAKLHQANVNERVIIDCSHGNSQKNFRNQSRVCESVAKQIQDDCSRKILGVMIESHIHEGAQPHIPGCKITKK